MCQRGWFPLRAATKNLSYVFLLAPGGMLAIAGVPWACRSIAVISAFVFTQCSPGVCVSVHIYPFCKDTSCTGLGPILMTSLYLVKDPIFQKVPFLRYWGLGFQHIHFQGHDSTHSNGSLSWVLNAPCKTKIWLIFHSRMPLLPLSTYSLSNTNPPSRWRK